jgi:hypothetical protein
VVVNIADVEYTEAGLMKLTSPQLKELCSKRGARPGIVLSLYLDIYYDIQLFSAEEGPYGATTPSAGGHSSKCI